MHKREPIIDFEEHSVLYSRIEIEELDHMRYLLKIPVCIFVMGILVACQTASSTTRVPESIELQTGTPGLIAENTQTQTLAPPSTPDDTIMNSPTSPDADAQKMVDLATNYLAQRLGTSVEQIILLEVKSVVWGDASLGCPKPAIDYIRVETPGYNIAFRVGGETYNVHTDTENRVVTCSSP